MSGEGRRRTELREEHGPPKLERPARGRVALAEEEAAVSPRACAVVNDVRKHDCGLIDAVEDKPQHERLHGEEDVVRDTIVECGQEVRCAADRVRARGAVIEEELHRRAAVVQAVVPRAILGALGHDVPGAADVKSERKGERE